MIPFEYEKNIFYDFLNVSKIQKHLSQKQIKVVEDMMNNIVIHFNQSMPDKDIPKHVDLFFTSENNPYGVISLKWLDGDELGFVLKPREMYYHYTDLEIRRYKFTNKQKSMGQRSCSNKSTIECTTFG